MDLAYLAHHRCERAVVLSDENFGVPVETEIYSWRHGLGSVFLLIRTSRNERRAQDVASLTIVDLVSFGRPLSECAQWAPYRPVGQARFSLCMSETNQIAHVLAPEIGG